MGSGEVGIGTNQPTAPLHVSGDRIRLEPWQSTGPANPNAGDIALVNAEGKYWLYAYTEGSEWKRTELETIS